MGRSLCSGATPRGRVKIDNYKSCRLLKNYGGPRWNSKFGS